MDLDETPEHAAFFADMFQRLTDNVGQALLGKVVTVGDTVSLLPRDLGPGTSNSAASAFCAATRSSPRKSG